MTAEISRSTVESAHAAVENEEGLLALSPNYIIMSSNQAAERMLHTALPPGTRFKPEKVWRQPHLDRIRNALQQAFKTGRAIEPLIISNDTGTKKNDHPTITIQPLFESLDKIIGIILTIKPPAYFKPYPDTTKDRIKEDPIISVEHELLLESLPEGVFTIDTHWIIQSFNNRAESITGYRRKEVIGRHCWEIFRSDLCQLGCPLKTALSSGITCMDQDVRILKKGGKRQTILVNTGVLRTATGKIRGAVETFRPLAGESYFNGEGTDGSRFAKIIGRSESMQRIFTMLPDISASDANVLITGESGTGKDLIARTIHDHSSRYNKPFVAVNCSALAESLLESELFGHEKAAFTGAVSSKIGRFELAKGGTLFLDEIGELKPELQIKLLRVLENHEFERVGDSHPRPMEARIISATNKDLRQAIHDGHFREDFYFRLRTVPLSIPSLRERKEDIPLLVEYFLKNFNERFKKRVMSIHPDVMQVFMQYNWPGNVRELERTLEHAFVFVKGPIIMPTNLPASDEFHILSNSDSSPNGKTSQRPNRQALKWALLQSNGNRQEAARLLGMSRTTLWRHMRQMGLQ